MKRIIALIWLLISVPALAGPQVTVLLPVTGSMSPQAISDAFRGSASVRAALPGLPIGLITTSLYTSDVALVVLDATHGPLPANREHVLATRQARVPFVYVLITNVDALYGLVGEKEGREFLALEEQEIRAVLEGYGIGGANTPVYHDSAQGQRSTASMAGDLGQLASDLSALPSGKRQDEPLTPARVAEGEVYLLTDEEANGQAATINGARDLELWIGGQSATATVHVDGTARPGDVVSIRYRTDAPLPAAPGARLMLINDDRVVGIGVVFAVTAR